MENANATVYTELTLFTPNHNFITVQVPSFTFTFTDNIYITSSLNLNIVDLSTNTTYKSFLGSN